MFGWFNKKKNVPLKKESTLENISEITFNEEENSDFISIKESDKGELGVVFNSDKFSKEGARQLYQHVSKEMKIPFFEGTVENGYDLDKVKSKEICPKCNEKLHQRYSHFVYSNGEVSRVNTSPFGYFCEDCPTVVIDVRKLRDNLPDEVSFHGIAGVDIPEEGLTPFKKWNDETPVFIFDEDEHMIGITTRSEMKNNSERYEDYYQSWDSVTNELPPSPSKVKRKSKNRKRNKSAKKSRRNNRRKK